MANKIAIKANQILKACYIIELFEIVLKSRIGDFFILYFGKTVGDNVQVVVGFQIIEYLNCPFKELVIIGQKINILVCYFMDCFVGD